MIILLLDLQSCFMNYDYDSVFREKIVRFMQHNLRLFIEALKVPAINISVNID